MHDATFEIFVETAVHPAETALPFLRNVIVPATLDVALIVAEVP